MNNTVHKGTELKFNINIKPLGTLTMDDYDFECAAYCVSAKKLIIPKSHCIRLDNSNYIITVDTEYTGMGELKVQLTAKIPDADFHDGLRTEVLQLETGITVIR